MHPLLIFVARLALIVFVLVMFLPCAIADMVEWIRRNVL